MVVLLSLVVYACTDSGSAEVTTYSDEATSLRCPTCPVFNTGDVNFVDPIPNTVNDFISESCFDAANLGCGVPSTLGNSTIQHPDYPNCIFRVEYAVQRCPNEYNLSDYQIVGGTCPEFIQDLNDLRNDEVELAELIDRFDRLMFQEIFDDIYQGLNNNTFGTFCNGPLPQFTTIAAYRDDCIKICVSEIGKDQVYEKLKCSDNCCIISTKYCTDAITGEIIPEPQPTEVLENSPICADESGAVCFDIDAEPSVCLALCVN